MRTENTISLKWQQVWTYLILIGIIVYVAYNIGGGEARQNLREEIEAEAYIAYCTKDGDSCFLEIPSFGETGISCSKSDYCTVQPRAEGDVSEFEKLLEKLRFEDL